jgi:putative DNA primase/helicase
VVAPPSLHRSGKEYAWISQSPIADAPQWLIDLCLQKQQQLSTTSEGEPIPEGERNQTLASDAGAMRRRGMTETAIEAALQVENRERCQPPLPEAEVREIATSVSRYSPVTDTTSGYISKLDTYKPGGEPCLERTKNAQIWGRGCQRICQEPGL